MRSQISVHKVSFACTDWSTIIIFLHAQIGEYNHNDVIKTELFLGNFHRYIFKYKLMYGVNFPFNIKIYSV